MSKVAPIILQPLTGAGREKLPAAADPGESAGPQTVGSFEQAMASAGSAKQPSGITGGKDVITIKQPDNSEGETDKDNQAPIEEQSILGQVLAGLAALTGVSTSAAGTSVNSDTAVADAMGDRNGTSSATGLAAGAADMLRTGELPAGDPGDAPLPAEAAASAPVQVPAAIQETADKLLNSGNNPLPEEASTEPAAGPDETLKETSTQNRTAKPAGAAAATEAASLPAADADQIADTAGSELPSAAGALGNAAANRFISPADQAAAGFGSGSDTGSPAGGETEQEDSSPSDRPIHSEAAAGTDPQITWSAQTTGSDRPGASAPDAAGQTGNTGNVPVETTEPLIESIEVLSGNEDGGRQMTVHLKPDAYGTVQIRLFQNQGGLTAQIWTDKPATCDLLQSQLPDLVKQIQDQGVAISGASVFLDMGQSGGQTAEQNTQSDSVRQMDLRQIRSGRRGASIRQEQSQSIGITYGPAQSVINYYV